MKIIAKVPTKLRMNAIYREGIGIFRTKRPMLPKISMARMNMNLFPLFLMARLLSLTLLYAFLLRWNPVSFCMLLSSGFHDLLFHLVDLLHFQMGEIGQGLFSEMQTQLVPGHLLVCGQPPP